MKLKSLIVLSLLLAVAVISNAQSSKSLKTLKKTLELSIPGDLGANGASVAWHPGLKRYYAAMAGNATYPLAVFDAKGTRISSKEQETLFDIRGLWYNPSKKTFEMNGYLDNGWAEYVLNSKGFPTEATVSHSGQNQPTSQSVGVYNSKSEEVYFFNEDGNIDVYSDGSFIKTIDLYLGAISPAEEDDNYMMMEYYNTSAIIYTGIKGAEIGLMNFDDKTIELYNIETGYITRIFQLPETAPVQSALNFSYSNGIYWLFNKEERKWEGYK